MVTREDIEQFLDRLSAEGASYKEVRNGLWVVKPGGSLDFDLVVHFSPPVVVMRVKVMELPTDKESLAQLSRRLLELNATEMLHGSYGIEQDAVVITEALELSHLNFEEFLAVYESIALALASQLREIGELGTSGTHRVPAAARKAAAKNDGSGARRPRNGKTAQTARNATKGGAKGARSGKGARGATPRGGRARGRR
jgi:hypothetical protein